MPTKKDIDKATQQEIGRQVKTLLDALNHDPTEVTRVLIEQKQDTGFTVQVEHIKRNAEGMPYTARSHDSVAETHFYDGVWPEEVL